MAIRDIVLYPDKILEQKCPPVPEVTDEVRQLIDDMVETMYDAPGIGLAAPQVGVKQRITVIDTTAGEEEGNLHVFINPEIVEREGHIRWEEGCLSIPGIYENVDRSRRIVVRALDRHGESFELEASELLAVCIQHEIDHLDGTVFLDHLSRLKQKILLKKYKKHLDKMERSKTDDGPGN